MPSSVLAQLAAVAVLVCVVLLLSSGSGYGAVVPPATPVSPNELVTAKEFNRPADVDIDMHPDQVDESDDENVMVSATTSTPPSPAPLAIVVEKKLPAEVMDSRSAPHFQEISSNFRICMDNPSKRVCYKTVLYRCNKRREALRQPRRCEQPCNVGGNTYSHGELLSCKRRNRRRPCSRHEVNARKKLCSCRMCRNGTVIYINR